MLAVIAVAAVGIALLLFLGVMRRGGLAAWVALLAGIVIAGSAPPDPVGGVMTAAVAFVGIRVAQSHVRSHSAGRAAAIRDRLAGRPVCRAVKVEWGAPGCQESTSRESEPKRLPCEGRRGRHY